MQHAGVHRRPVLSFLGGARTVTGSRFLVDGDGARVLVECGLFQGLKDLRLRNWARFPVDPASIDAVVLTHAHVDHCGYVPALARNGFHGPVVVTPATAELCGVVLPDSGHLQEEDAAYANRKGFSKHAPALPLYTEDDARRSLRLLRPAPFGSVTEIAPGFTVTFARAGHILGSAIATLDVGDRRIVFSGDLGRDDHPLLRPPEPIGEGADVVVVESTYGDRSHEEVAAVDVMRDAIVRTVGRGGTVVIPAFAVDRTEVVLFHLGRLIASGQIPDVPVYVDSPMALRCLDIYRDAVAEGSPEVRSSVIDGGDPFAAEHVIEVRDVEGSMELDANPVPSVLVSASGMATGGRVVHHLRRRLPDARSTVLLVGFQAAGTRGRDLAEGARQVKMLGRYVPVRAEVVAVPGLSAHADGRELAAWVETAPGAPGMIYVVHGELAASEALCDRIHDDRGWPAVVPHQDERVVVG